MRGPIDYIVVGFKDKKVDGSILKPLAEAIDNGIVSLVALSVVQKADDGTVSALEITDVQDDYLVEFTQKYPGSQGTVDKDDIDEVGELLENGDMAGLLMIEHLWAKPLKQAILDANGVLIAEGRIHPDAAKEIDN